MDGEAGVAEADEDGGRAEPRVAQRDGEDAEGHRERHQRRQVVREHQGARGAVAEHREGQRGDERDEEERDEAEARPEAAGGLPAGEERVRHLRQQQPREEVEEQRPYAVAQEDGVLRGVCEEAVEAAAGAAAEAVRRVVVKVAATDGDEEGGPADARCGEEQHQHRRRHPPPPAAPSSPAQDAEREDEHELEDVRAPG